MVVTGFLSIIFKSRGWIGSWLGPYFPAKIIYWASVRRELQYSCTRLLAGTGNAVLGWVQGSKVLDLQNTLLCLREILVPFQGLAVRGWDPPDFIILMHGELLRLSR